METPAAQKTLNQIGDSAKRISEIAEGWVFQADTERRFHFRTDHREIDQLLEFIVESSLIFGQEA